MLPTPRLYFTVWAALMALLAATVGAYCLPLGPFNLVLSLGIAGAKAMLVVLFFMHVRYQPRLVWLWAGVGFYWLAIMVGLTLMDTLTRGWVALPGK